MTAAGRRSCRSTPSSDNQRQAKIVTVDNKGSWVQIPPSRHCKRPAQLAFVLRSLNASGVGRPLISPCGPMVFVLLLRMVTALTEPADRSRLSRPAHDPVKTTNRRMLASTWEPTARLVRGSAMPPAFVDSVRGGGPCGASDHGDRS